jgi:hypothetical protein
VNAEVACWQNEIDNHACGSTMAMALATDPMEREAAEDLTEQTASVLYSMITLNLILKV